MRSIDDAALHEIRLAGRGGQGVVTAGELLGRAAICEGRWAQSIPTFGPERRGALTQAILRIGPDPILLKCTTARPNALLVLDPTVWHFANVVIGVRDGADLIFNAACPPEAIAAALRSGRYGYTLAARGCSIWTVDATALALEALGRPITNTAMMGALAGATGLLDMVSVEAVLAERFGEGAGPNIRAARAAFNHLVGLGG